MVGLRHDRDLCHRCIRQDLPDEADLNLLGGRSKEGVKDSVVRNPSSQSKSKGEVGFGRPGSHANANLIAFTEHFNLTPRSRYLGVDDVRAIITQSFTHPLDE